MPKLAVVTRQVRVLNLSTVCRSPFGPFRLQVPRVVVALNSAALQTSAPTIARGSIDLTSPLHRHETTPLSTIYCTVPLLGAANIVCLVTAHLSAAFYHPHCCPTASAPAPAPAQVFRAASPHLVKPPSGEAFGHWDTRTHEHSTEQQNIVSQNFGEASWAAAGTCIFIALAFSLLGAVCLVQCCFLNHLSTPINPCPCHMAQHGQPLFVPRTRLL